MVKWVPFRHGGAVYDLSHLHPTTVVFSQPESGAKPARDYTTDVVFGLHCFTRGPRDGERIDVALRYSDAREARIFDFQRYELSKLLPAIVGALPCRKCFHTERGNFFTVELVNGDDLPIDYEIYFEASRSSIKGRLNLFVQSAYVRDRRHGSNRPHRNPIRFLVIMFNTLHGKAIKAAPGR
jgi:hypothetical protein